MTERGWLTGDEPKKLLDYLQGKFSNRKLRLFAVACCQRLRHLLNDERSQRAIEVAERFADGEAGQAELATASHSHHQAFVWAKNLPAYWAVEALMEDTLYFSIRPVLNRAVDAIGSTEGTHQCLLLRDLFGNPFRSPSLDPSWLRWHGGLLVSMARRMYDGHDFSDMPVLADAIEEAGCGDADILTHCHQPGPHVRGCWLIDALIGKS